MPDISATIDTFSRSYSCLAGLTVGKSVYLSATNTVALADGTDPTKMPAIGIVESKPTATTCIVQYFGELENVLSGLTPKSLYYVGAAGVLVSSPAGLAVAQVMGVARSATSLVMAPPAAASGGGGAGNLNLVRYVDDTTGNDSNPGSAAAPFKTITAALASITDASSSKIYVIQVEPGYYNEGGVPVVWKDNVGLIGVGVGEDAVVINNGINYTAGAGVTSFVTWAGVKVFTATRNLIDISAATFPSFSLLSAAQVSPMTFTGGGAVGNFFSQNCNVFDLEIVSGGVYIFGGDLGYIQLDDTPAHPANATLIGCGATGINISGSATADLRGTAVLGVITGIVTVNGTPVITLDSGSLTESTIVGTIKFIFGDAKVATPSTNFTVTKESFVSVNATAAPVAVTLPKAVNYAGKSITVAKNDVSGNAVTVTAVVPDLINGAATKVLAAQFNQTTLRSDGTIWVAT